MGAGQSEFKIVIDALPQDAPTDPFPALCPEKQEAKKEPQSPTNELRSPSTDSKKAGKGTHRRINSIPSHLMSNMGLSIEPDSASSSSPIVPRQIFRKRIPELFIREPGVRKYDEVLGSFPDPMMVVRSDNVIIYSNNAFISIFGKQCNKNELLLSTLPDFPIDFSTLSQPSQKCEYDFGNTKFELSNSKLLADDSSLNLVCFKDVTQQMLLKHKLYQEYMRSEQLLEALLPVKILERFKKGEKDIFEQHKDVTIGFCDIVQFTQLTSRYPEKIHHTLNKFFAKLDEFTKNLGLTKIETIGDSYLVCAGLFDSDENNSAKIVEFMEQTMVFAKYELDIQLRCGIDKGAISSGLIGNILPHFSIFGLPVIIASRLQSTSMPSRIHVSQAVIDALEESDYSIISRGTQDLKGIGKTNTYFISKK